MSLIETVSLSLQPALTTGYSTSQAFSPAIATLQEPSADGTIPPVWLPGMLQQNRIKVLPFADIGPGSNFSMRVYGWHQAPGSSGASIQNMWVPTLLAELLCVTCDSPGPGALLTVPAGVVPMTGNFCDTITLSQGALGTGGAWTGAINSTGPGTNLIAYTILELLGAQKISFDFAYGDFPNPGMNCLFCLC